MEAGPTGVHENGASMFGAGMVGDGVGVARNKGAGV